jgi:diguanylate cyclase (GGDEF)-like protein/PAS domain S-box-containing protein
LPSAAGHLFCAFLSDISERKRSELALISSRQQLHTIANNLPIQIAYIDSDRIVRFINDTYRTDTGLTPENTLGKHLREFLRPAFYDEILPHIETALAGERASFETVTRFRRRELVWSTVYIPDFSGGSVAGFFIMSQDITARKKLEYSLHHRATRDALTGLPNRPALLERLNTAIHSSQQAGEGLALFFLDLDGFKAINDTYGHDAGDSILQQFAKRLTHIVRSTDMVARLSGDEFVILLESQGDGACPEKVGAKILDAMKAPFLIGRTEVHMGTSVGLYVDDATSIIDAEAMLKLADQAMYEAKRQGKNRMCTASLQLPSGGERIRS